MGTEQGAKAPAPEAGAPAAPGAASAPGTAAGASGGGAPGSAPPLSGPSIGNASVGGGAAPSQASGTASAPGSASAAAGPRGLSPEQLVLELIVPEHRENALLDLSKKRETFPDLAPILWHSCGTIAALLQEIVSIYPMLSPPTLTAGASNRVCNALALLQCVASHPDTRALFLNAHIPLYLYPFLNTVSKTRPFEYLRLTSLGVIGALVKVDDTDVINFLLSTEIIPLCLRTMELGSELSKTVATFIVQKILLDDVGLSYICATAERFFAVSTVLGNMVGQLAEQQSVRLLKHIIRCYLRLSDNPRACEALRTCLPDLLRDANFTACLRDDLTTRRWLTQLLLNVGSPSGTHAGQRPAGGLTLPGAVAPAGAAPAGSLLQLTEQQLPQGA